MNRKAGKKTSKYRGVSYNGKNKKWKSVITVKGTQHFLGYFENEEEAAYAYDNNSIKMRGGSKLNFPLQAGVTGGEHTHE